MLQTPFIPPFAAPTSSLFKIISPPSPSSPVSSPDDEPQWRLHRNAQPAVRIRCARGGRHFMDRRDACPPLKRRRLGLDGSDDADTLERIAERYRFDQEDAPAVGAAGWEEQDRQLENDYTTRSVVQLGLRTILLKVIQGHDWYSSHARRLGNTLAQRHIHPEDPARRQRRDDAAISDCRYSTLR